jgi:hypothetical protein
VHRVLLTAFTMLATILPGGVSAKIVSTHGVLISSCVVNAKNNLTNGINIVFYNAHPTAATEVDFLVVYNGARYTLTDKGTFSRGAPINHDLRNALVGSAWQGPKPQLCQVQRVLLANGKIIQ